MARARYIRPDCSTASCSACRLCNVEATQDASNEGTHGIHSRRSAPDIGDRYKRSIVNTGHKKSFVFKAVNSALLADPPNLIGRFRIKIWKFEGNSSGVLAGATVVVVHGIE